MLKHLKTFTGHQNPVYALANSDKSGIFFSAGNDKGIVEWSLRKMAFIAVKWPVNSSVYCLHNYNNQLFAGERSGQFSTYDFIQQKVVAAVNAHQKPIFDIKTIRKNNHLITVSEDGTMAIWSLADFSEIYRFQVAADTVRTIALSVDENEIALGCKDNIIRIYSTGDYTLLHELHAHMRPITALAYHPTGKYLISGARDAQLKVWDANTYAPLTNIPAHMFSIYDIAFHPTLPYFATASQDKSIKLWDAENFKLYKILSIEKAGIGHMHSVNKLIWSDDGKFLISTGDDRKVMVWEWDQ